MEWEWEWNENGNGNANVAACCCPFAIELIRQKAIKRIDLLRMSTRGLSTRTGSTGTTPDPRPQTPDL